MATLSFNTNGSGRVSNKVKALLPSAWSMAASLGSKRRSFHVSNFNGDFEDIKQKLKSLGCTSIKLS